jgi:glycosyltransferase involved in cell wall biosynthesis
MGNADGVVHLVEAAHHIVRTRGRTDVQFLLMGTGPEHANLVRRRDQLGLRDHLDLPGRVSNEFLFTALQTIDVGVACDPINAYNDHCTMNKTLEYMAFGKPQVLFDVREGRFSAGEAARYVPETSAALLGDAILELLDDPEPLANAWAGSAVNASERTQLGSLRRPTPPRLRGRPRFMNPRGPHRPRFRQRRPGRPPEARVRCEGSGFLRSSVRRTSRLAVHASQLHPGHRGILRLACRPAPASP